MDSEQLHIELSTPVEVKQVRRLRNIVNMSSRSSSLSSAQSKCSSTSSLSSYKTSNPCGIGSDDYRIDILEPNNILLEQVMMDEERWSSLAFSMGIPVHNGQRFNNDAQKLASRMSRRRNPSYSHTFGYLLPFLEAIVAECPGMSLLSRCAYHKDAVPTHEVLRNTTRRLPIPRPLFSLGYSNGNFPRHHIEVQDGIIAGPNDEPCNLKHISQPLVDHFWPFLVVDISERSMQAAQQANAVAASTCNNALNILATAVAPTETSPTATFKFDASKAKTFSLAICGKEACLSLHAAQGTAPFVATDILVYRLDRMNDVAALADRMYGIMLWSRHQRLPEISTTLDALDQRVHGTTSLTASRDSADDFDPACLKTLALKSSRRTAGSDRIRVAFKASLPHWLG